MALDWIILLAVIALVVYLIFKIVKKIIKIILSVFLVVLVGLFVLNFALKLDADKLENNLQEGNVIFLYKDVLGFEAEPFKVIEEGDLDKEYADLIGDSDRIIIYNSSILDELDYDITGTSYEERVESFKEITEGINVSFLVEQVRKGNIHAYPRSPLIYCAEKCPNFIIKKYMNR